MDNEITIFDFDGVLLDTSKELVVTGYNIKHRPIVKTYEEVEPRFRSFMSQRRAWARNGGETSTLALLAHQNPDAQLSRADFDQKVLSFKEAGKLLDLQKDFFEGRLAFLAEDRSAWLALNKPYQPIWDTICERLQGQIQILTYKNKEAVIELCDYFGLKIGAVHSIPTGVTKTAVLLELSRQAKIVHYVDDAYRNLLEIQEELGEKNIDLLWATWGYGCDRTMYDPKLNGAIKAVNQNDVLRLL